MNLSDIENNLRKIEYEKSDFEFSLKGSANESDFENIENKFRIIVPDKTKEFFWNFNGLITKNPDFELKQVSDWEMTESELLYFAIFDNKYKIGFDTRVLNSANQWTIKNIENHYELTLTMSSFWSNKIWHWIRYKKKIWDDKYWE